MEFSWLDSDEESEEDDKDDSRSGIGFFAMRNGRTWRLAIASLVGDCERGRRRGRLGNGSGSFLSSDVDEIPLLDRLRIHFLGIKKGPGKFDRDQLEIS